MSEPKNNIAPRAAVGAVSKGRKTTMERRSFFSWLAVGWIGFAGVTGGGFLQLFFAISIQMCFLSRLNLLK